MTTSDYSPGDGSVAAPGQPDQPGAVPPAPLDEPRTATIRGERVRWGSVWAGAVIAVATFLVLQLLFFALGWLDLGIGVLDTASNVVSAILALIAFFAGGLLAGRSAARRDAEAGLLHGVLVWALSVVGMFILALLGGGPLLGSLGVSAAQVIAAAPVSPAEAAALLQAAQNGAGWAALWLGLAVVAAAVGGAVGPKTGKRARQPGR